MTKWPGFDLYAELIADVERRFWVNVQKTPTCWVWTGNKTDDGYGRLRIAGKMRRASVISWTLHFSPIPPMGLICHHCDNPPCVRPSHLFLGDHSLNSHDLQLKKRTQVSAVVPQNEGDLLDLIAARRAELELQRINRQLAQENRRHLKAARIRTTKVKVGDGLYVPTPAEVEERRRTAAEGERRAQPMYFTDDEIREIRSVPDYPGINSDLGRRFNVSRQSIVSIRIGRTYAHVSDLPGPGGTRKEETA